MDKDKALVAFQDKKIRRIWYSQEWFYSVIDIVEVLTDSPTPRQYWGKVKDREFIALELSPIWVQLKLAAEDGKLRFTDCVNTKNAFRLVQSIPSKKAEPFKQWLAQLATKAGTTVVIANGRKNDILTKILNNECIGTIFIPNVQNV